MGRAIMQIKIKLSNLVDKSMYNIFKIKNQGINRYKKYFYYRILLEGIWEIKTGVFSYLTILKRNDVKW